MVDSGAAWPHGKNGKVPDLSPERATWRPPPSVLMAEIDQTIPEWPIE
ncbi:MAG: hypothetical protein ACXQT2_05550 [Methanotrichaceae archaeon]